MSIMSASKKSCDLDGESLGEGGCGCVLVLPSSEAICDLFPCVVLSAQERLSGCHEVLNDRGYQTRRCQMHSSSRLSRAENQRRRKVRMNGSAWSSVPLVSALAQRGDQHPFPMQWTYYRVLAWESSREACPELTVFNA